MSAITFRSTGWRRKKHKNGMNLSKSRLDSQPKAKVKKDQFTIYPSQWPDESLYESNIKVNSEYEDDWFVILDHLELAHQRILYYSYQNQQFPIHLWLHSLTLCRKKTELFLLFGNIATRSFCNEDWCSCDICTFLSIQATFYGNGHVESYQINRDIQGFVFICKKTEIFLAYLNGAQISRCSTMLRKKAHVLDLFLHFVSNYWFYGS